MLLYEWIWCFFVETAKYLVVTYGVLGLKLNMSNRRWLAFLYPLVGIPVMISFSLPSWVFRVLWYVIFVQVFFEERFVRKLQVVFAQYIIFSTLDTFIWSLCQNFFPQTTVDLSLQWIIISEGIGLVLWILFAFLLRKKKKAVYSYLEMMTPGYYALFLVMCLSMSAIIGILQLSVLEFSLSARMKRIMLLAVLVVMFIMLVVFILFLYLLSNKYNMEQMLKINEEHIQHQKEYYENLVVKDEDLRMFRHDFGRHMRVLEAKCEARDWDGVAEYVSALSEEKKEQTIYKTGNQIADYFLNGVLYELKKDKGVECVVVGRFPSEIRMSDYDFCVLFGNALSNAKEAIEKGEGKGVLHLEITNYKNRCFAVLTNSLGEEQRKEGVNLVSDKEDLGKHGYGVKNMRRISAKYDVLLEWKQINDKMEVTMEI